MSERLVRSVSYLAGALFVQRHAIGISDQLTYQVHHDLLFQLTPILLSRARPREDPIDANKLSKQLLIHSLLGLHRCL